MKVVPSDTYDGLLRQFRALVNLCNSMEQQRIHMLKTMYTESQVKELQKLLDEERSINEQLTNELEKRGIV